MKMPTAVDQLPSFSSGGTVSFEPSSNNGIPFLIAGGVLIAAIGVYMVVNRMVQRDRMKFKMQAKVKQYNFSRNETEKS